MFMRISRAGTVAIAATSIGVLWAASPAFAHVGVDKDEIEAGSATSLSFSFSHGCAESPTNSMSFEIPEGIINAVPQVHAGWDIEVERADLPAPVEAAHGDPITDRAAVITFTARDGFEVPGGQKDTMMISFTAPETEGVLAFPVIQGCVEGANNWIEIWDGIGEEPESPAPSVTVVAATAGTGSDMHGDGDEAATATIVAVDAAADESAEADDDSDDDGGSDTLAIVGIVVGALALGVGGVALVKANRKPGSPS
jgi:periplasmic copper chaperone A